MSVYFIRRKDDPSMIKIGSTGDIVQRIGSMTAALGPLVLIGTMRGGKAIERSLHALLHAQRREGEWFEVNETVIALMKGIELSGREFVPTARSWRSEKAMPSMATDSDIACYLVDECLKGYPIGTKIAGALEEIFSRLHSVNEAWTRRRVRAMHERVARRIELFEIIDLLRLAGVEEARWADVISGRVLVGIESKAA